jgi:hypothetical protein
LPRFLGFARTSVMERTTNSFGHSWPGQILIGRGHPTSPGRRFLWGNFHR